MYQCLSSLHSIATRRLNNLWLILLLILIISVMEIYRTYLPTLYNMRIVFIHLLTLWDSNKYLLKTKLCYTWFVNPLLPDETVNQRIIFFTLVVVLAFTDYDVASYLIVIMTPYLGLLDDNCLLTFYC